MAKVLLVVDDEPYIRSFIKAKLSRIIPDLVIQEAADGEQAMSAITSGDIDLVTIDINMPFINGVELINNIKQKPDHAQLPIIVVSANVSQAVRDTLTTMGVTEIYGKLDITTNNSPESPFIESVKRYIS
jgi:CheY-like chemotaxis protein